MRSRSASTDQRRATAPAWALALALSSATALVPSLTACDGRGTRNPDALGTTLHIAVAVEDADADVYIDGNYVGQVAEIQGTKAGPMRLAPGVHRFEVRKDGRFPFQRTLDIDTKQPPAKIEVAVELLEDPR